MSIKGFSVNGVTQKYDYTALDNKPSINGVELSGNKTAAQLGLVTPSDIPAASISNDLKQALLQLAQKVAYVDADGQDYYQDLYDALYPSATLTSITANFNQGSTTVYTTDTLDSLRTMLVVTANYDDETTRTVTDYTLSGSLTAGTSVITASYGGETDTFNVTVTRVAGTFSISNNLTGCSSSNSATTIAENASYNATITANTGYTLTGATVSITMGGSSVTGYYSNGTISIPNVTGDVVITVVATAVTLSSISAVFNQGSATIYDTDSLDSLKSDLVVTATYSDSSTAIVPSADYTLSGTLAVGTSTITVTYGGKTATFNVTVTQAPVSYLYNWDFTQSLIDSVEGQETTLGAASGTDNATRDSNGLTFSAATQYAYLGAISPVGKTIEIDVASFDFKGNTNYHIRFFTNAQYATATSKGLGAICWKKGEGWKSYGWTDETSTSAAWSANFWSSDLTGTSSDVINAFNGKTVKLVYHSDGHTKDLYLDDVYKGTIDDIYFNNAGSSSHQSDKLFIAGMGSTNQNSGDQCFDMTITGVRIYANNL